MKGITKTIKNETKEQKGGFLSMLLGTLGTSLLGNMLTGKGMLRAGYGNKQGKGMLRAGYCSKDLWSKSLDLLIPAHQNEPKINRVYFRDNLPKRIKNGAYVMNLDEYADISIHWIALYAKNIEIILTVLELNMLLKKSFEIKNLLLGIET